MPVSTLMSAWFRRGRMVQFLAVRTLAVPLALGMMAGVGVGAGFGGAFAAGEVVAAASSTAGWPPTSSVQEAGMVAGKPFRDPPDANSVSDPRLAITLTAAETRFNLSGRRVWGQAYDGAFVAPTLHLAPGRTATIVLVNRLPVATSLHFHGLHVSPADHSDDALLCAAPGGSLTYRLHIPANHPQGTYWYHSHAMGTTCSTAAMADMASASGDVENQIFAGLSGALIVGDDRSLLPNDLRDVVAHTFVLKDVQIDRSNHIVQNTTTTSIDSDDPTVRLVNGQLRPVLTMRPGETQLWRFVNAGADIFYQLQLAGYQFTIIGEDGRPIAEVTTAGSLLLPPAKRFDVLVTAGSRASAAWLRTLSYSNGPQGDSYPTTNLVEIDVDGRGQAPLPTVSGAMLSSPRNLSGAAVARHRELTLSEDDTGTVFYIDGKQFSMDRSVFATPARLGTVEEWTIYNASGEVHPFHLHTNAFQVMSINGVPKPYTGRQDIVAVPNAVNGVPGKVVIRIPFADFAGKWMFHCHIAAHEDNGMMSYINVVR
jgi:suppressor of ftsI